MVISTRFLNRDECTEDNEFYDYNKSIGDESILTNDIDNHKNKRLCEIIVCGKNWNRKAYAYQCSIEMENYLLCL